MNSIPKKDIILRLAKKKKNYSNQNQMSEKCYAFHYQEGKVIFKVRI